MSLNLKAVFVKDVFEGTQAKSGSAGWPRLSGVIKAVKWQSKNQPNFHFNFCQLSKGIYRSIAKTFSCLFFAWSCNWTEFSSALSDTILYLHVNSPPWHIRPWFECDGKKKYECTILDTWKIRWPHRGSHSPWTNVLKGERLCRLHTQKPSRLKAQAGLEFHYHGNTHKHSV